MFDSSAVFLALFLLLETDKWKITFGSQWRKQHISHYLLSFHRQSLKGGLCQIADSYEYFWAATKECSSDEQLSLLIC